jgi:DNA-binding response OmpR family regulator
MGAWEFLSELREIAPGSSPAVLVLTAATTIGDEWLRANGCAGIIRKPFDEGFLIARVREQLFPTNGRRDQGRGGR